MKSIYEKQMEAVLKQYAFKFQSEFHFHPDRKWRFDFIILPVDLQVAIEVDGAIWSGGRHSKGKGFINDAEKYNAAQIMGWTVLRYAPETIPNVIKDLQLIAKQHGKII